jgi:hypothetical protein
MAKKTTDEDEDQTAGTGAESDEDEEDPKGAAGAESDEDDEEEPDEDDEDAVIATLTPEQAKVFNSLTEKLGKANASARNKRLALRALRKGQGTKETAPKPTAPKTGGTGKEGAPAAFDPEAFKAELIASIKGEQAANQVQSAAEKALRRAGLILPDDEDKAERKIQRVMRMLDLDGVPLDEVQDEIDDLKSDNPELFGKVKRKRPAAGGVGGPARVAGAKATNRIAELFD